MVITPDSSGWRSASSDTALNSGASSRKSTPWWACETNPGRTALLPPPMMAAWLALWGDKDAYCPTGFRLKEWLFGGHAIKADHALFHIEDAKIGIIADLFGDEKLIADADPFWTHQTAEVEARRTAYLNDGWSDVIILECGQRFDRYDFRHTSKAKGGRIYVELRKSGEVTFHEGYVTEKEAAARARQETGAPVERVSRPEVTSAMND